MTNNLKVLHLDIETAPAVAYVWGLHKQNVGIHQIVKPGFTLCYAAKWHGEDDIIFKSLFHDTKKDMLQSIWSLMDEADAVVHYNGKKFDVPILNKEFVLNGMTPASPVHEIDLLNVVKSNFRFMSNKLDFVAQQLGIGGKVSHKGFSLWEDCMTALNIPRDTLTPELIQSWENMKTYNIQDTVLLEDLYLKLLPWIKGHPNQALWLPRGEDKVCPNCGSTNLSFKSYKRTKVMGYKQYHCKDCGSYPRERYADDQFKKRVDVLTV